jgi:hypothetical protein
VCLFRYDLVITPDLEAFTFNGEVKIDLDVSADVTGNQITMHSKELCFISASFVDLSGVVQAAEEVRIHFRRVTFFHLINILLQLVNLIHFIPYPKNDRF